jgi:hypothetical protein
MKPTVRRGDGKALEPGDGVVPTLKELEHGYLKVVGTACWLTRYGLFLTAHHVLADLIDGTGAAIGVSFVLDLGPKGILYLRRILRVSLLRAVDLAIGHADNYLEKFPADPRENVRVTLSTTVPTEGEQLVTYGYAENEVLDFTDPDKRRVIAGEFFGGSFLRQVTTPENPFIPYPHFETTIEVKSGASGGPVFDSRGRVVGVNCRGWDFKGAEHEGDHLSSIVPVDHLWPLEVDPLGLPPQSWEYAQIPPEKRGKSLTVDELVAYGHVLLK